MRIMWAVRADICPVGNILDRSDCVTAVVYSFYFPVMIDIDTNLVI